MSAGNLARLPQPADLGQDIRELTALLQRVGASAHNPARQQLLLCRAEATAQELFQTHITPKAGPQTGPAGREAAICSVPTTR